MFDKFLGFVIKYKNAKGEGILRMIVLIKTLCCPVVDTRTGLPVPHRAPPHHLEPGSAPHTFAPELRFRTAHRVIFFMISFKKIWQVFMHYLF